MFFQPLVQKTIYSTVKHGYNGHSGDHKKWSLWTGGHSVRIVLKNICEDLKLLGIMDRV